MIKSVDEYLAQLKSELAGADPAIIQDALADSEDHLRTAHDQVLDSQPDMSGADALAQVVEEYGTPTEVAEGYHQLEARTRVPMAPRVKNGDTRSPIERFFGVFVDPRAYASFFYMCFSLITGVLYFTWAVTGLSLAVGLIVMIIGVPFTALFLMSVRGIALVEGRIIEALLGVRMPSSPLFSQTHLGMWERVKALFMDSRSWTTILYMIIQMPLGILYFSVCITMFSLGVGLIVTPVIQWWFDVSLFYFYGYSVWLPLWATPLVVLAGAFVVLLTLHLSKAIGRAHAAYAKALLVRD